MRDENRADVEIATADEEDASRDVGELLGAAREKLTNDSATPSNAAKIFISRFTYAIAVRSNFTICLENKAICEREFFVELSGIEPLTSCMPCRRSPS